MVIAIGMRVSPAEITFAVATVEEGAVQIRALDTVTVPDALDLPDKLRFVRTTLLDVIEEYGATRAGLKLVEHTAQGRHELRMNLEGVVQELLASSAVDRYFAGRIDRLAYLLGDVTRPQVRRSVRGEEPIDRLPHSDRYRHPADRESVLAAVAALSPRLI
jgi:hypothetical protein